MTERSLHHGVNLHILDVSEDQAVVVKQAEDINSTLALHAAAASRSSIASHS